ncbi:hypothetical protein PF010_g28583 [Phytophthora fragariae]|uniref:Uncharacterized protein n=1 Tax=Phytophthora fragariae TaxID=53985 RepID=A0A6G0JQP3_9STRA|nr:hypothetical protein PF010_g28583 [Phytophthora fragariae]
MPVVVAGVVLCCHCQLPAWCRCQLPAWSVAAVASGRFGLLLPVPVAGFICCWQCQLPAWCWCCRCRC